MADVYENMKYLISHAKADINLVSVCFQLIDGAASEEKSLLLEEFFIGFKNIPTKGDLEIPETMTEAELSKLMKRYGKIVEAQLEELQEQGLAEEEFYSSLWRYIAESPVFPNNKTRTVVLFRCAIDKKLPYYQIDRSYMLSMDNEEYKAIQESIGEKQLSKMEYVLNANFEQKTERASLIVQMLDELSDYEGKCVFMTRVINHFECEIMRLHLREM